MTHMLRYSCLLRVIPLLCGMLLPGIFATYAFGASPDQELAATATQIADQYRLAPGDRIKVSVLGQSDLSVEVQVSDSRSIIYPLLGELKVGGLSREETEVLIYQELKGPYLVEPVVSVTIVNYRPIFLQGEVRSPGTYSYTPGLSLRRAILNAGGFTDLAARSRIYVMNEFQPDKPEMRVDQDYELKPGDVVTVRASFF